MPKENLGSLEPIEPLTVTASYPDYPINSRIPYANYRFTNVGASTNILVNSGSKVLSFNESTGSPAVLLEARGVGNTSQRQIYSYGTSRQLYPEYTRMVTPYPGYTQLAIWDDNGGAVLKSKGNTPSITVIRHEDFAPVVKIQNPSGKYLAANASGTGVEFTATYSTRCEWFAERIYRMTGVYGFPKGVELFSAKTMSKIPPLVPRVADTSMEDGAIGDIWLMAAENLFIACFGEDKFFAASEINVYGNMYGALYNSSAFDGKFHTGIDINAGPGTVVKSPVAGTVVHSGADGNSNYGRVTIKVTDPNPDPSDPNPTAIYYTFLHLQEGTRIGLGHVDVGDTLGYEGDVGAGGAFHLHFELSSKDSFAKIPLSSFEDLDITYFPYDACYHMV